MKQFYFPKGRYFIGSLEALGDEQYSNFLKEFSGKLNNIGNEQQSQIWFAKVNKNCIVQDGNLEFIEWLVCIPYGMIDIQTSDIKHYELCNISEDFVIEMSDNKVSIVSANENKKVVIKYG